MYIQNLELTSYRNYDHAELQFENKVNVIIGENAQGKTNLMEAIYVLSMAKSHRTSNDKELIRWDKDYAKIEGRVMKQNGAIPMQPVISKRVKRARSIILNSKSSASMSGPSTPLCSRRKI